MDNVWTNLGNRLETAWKRPTRPNSKRPKDGEIIDEEKSVRWNREEAVRRQKAWDAECSRLKKAQNADFTGWAALFVKTCESNKMLLTPPTIEIVGFPGLRLVNFFSKKLFNSLTACATPIK